MSVYSKLAEIGSRYVSRHTLFKYGLNYSPMYRRTTARITRISEDLMEVDVRLPLNCKNRNYAGTIFGGSLFAAVDPIPMVQLTQLLGRDYIVWDKAAEIRFRRPANQTVYARLRYTAQEVEAVRRTVIANGETTIVKTTRWTDEDNATVYAEVDKTIYVATKAFYKEKQKKRRIARK